jgi:hypothetical protein
MAGELPGPFERSERLIEEFRRHIFSGVVVSAASYGGDTIWDVHTVAGTCSGPSSFGSGSVSTLGSPTALITILDSFIEGLREPRASLHSCRNAQRYVS